MVWYDCGENEVQAKGYEGSTCFRKVVIGGWSVILIHRHWGLEVLGRNDVCEA